MRTPKGFSGKQLGAKNTAALERYLISLKTDNKGLPSRNGKVSVKSIAIASGVELQSLYKNPNCRVLLELAAQELGLASMTREARAAIDDPRDRRIQSLEARIAVLQAEVDGLRANLRQLVHIEKHMVETGRRVIP